MKEKLFSHSGGVGNIRKENQSRSTLVGCQRISERPEDVDRNKTLIFSSAHLNKAGDKGEADNADGKGAHDGDAVEPAVGRPH
jgi:hypothetical protein